jgi:phosphoribosylglycinamide formyltransferase 2
MGVVKRIGTPLSACATRVMLLGCGELGKEVIIALQRLGCEVIGVDRYADAPGMQVAHRSHVVSMTDGAALRALIEREKPALVVPEIEAIATAALVEMERDGVAGHFPEFIPTARAAQLTMNREGIRRLAAEELGLPVSPYRFADTLGELQAAIDSIGFPCVVKPVMSSSGKGQSLLKGQTDVQAAWDYAQAGGRVAHFGKPGRVIVEGFIDFDYEITQLTVRAVGASGEVETFFCEPIGHVQVNGDYVESWQPMAMTPAALQKSRDIARAVTSNLGGRGIFGVELFVKGDQVWFSEVSPRPHDTGLVTLATQRLSEFELHARGDTGPAGRHRAAPPRRFGGDLRRHRRKGHRLRGRRRRTAGARIRPAPVRQAGEFRQAAHGRGGGECRHHRRSAHPGQAGGKPRQAGQGLKRP